MTGDVWEWVIDWYAPDYFRRSPVDNPRGPRTGDPKMQLGDSWLCSEIYCQGFRVAARIMMARDAGLTDFGFHCANSRTIRKRPTRPLRLVCEADRHLTGVSL